MEKMRYHKIKEDNPLSDEERILLSRLYKLDRQIETYQNNHKNESMNKLLPKTDFILKVNTLYQMMSFSLIEISMKRTKYTNNLVDIKKILEEKKQEEKK